MIFEKAGGQGFSLFKQCVLGVDVIDSAYARVHVNHFLCCPLFSHIFILPQYYSWHFVQRMCSRFLFNLVFALSHFDEGIAHSDLRGTFDFFINKCLAHIRVHSIVVILYLLLFYFRTISSDSCSLRLFSSRLPQSCLFRLCCIVVDSMIRSLCPLYFQAQ